MIVYINGGFGVGKTSAAELLVARLQPAMLFDPESIGGILRRTLSVVDARSDFQEYEMWIGLVESFVRALHRAYPSVAIVIPMSVLDSNRRVEFVTRMRAIDAEFYDVTLVVEPDELRRRVLERPPDAASHDWGLQHLAAAPSSSSFPDSFVIDTTHMTRQEVAAAIFAAVEGGAR